MMLTNLVGFLLALSVVLHILMLIEIYRQKFYAFLVPLFAYLNILLIFIEVCSIFLLKTSISPFEMNIIRIRFVAEAFIPPVLYLLAQNYSLSPQFPKINITNISIFLVSLVLSVMALSGLIFTGVISANGMSYPGYSPYFAFFLIYYYAIFYLLLTDFMRKYKTAQRAQEVANLHQLVAYILPASILFFSALHLLPILHILHPLLFTIYPVICLMILHITFRFQILEYNENSARIILFFLISLFFIVLVSFFPVQRPVLTYLLAIPALLAVYFLTGLILTQFQTALRKKSEVEEYSLEEELTQFVGEVGKLLDEPALARFLGDFAGKIMHCHHSAVIFSRFDIQPYEIAYLNGFESTEIEGFLTESAVLEKVEMDLSVLNRYDLPPASPVYREMIEKNLYFVIPMVRQEALLGMILLGDDRQQMRVFSRDVQFARLLSVQAASAIQNIRTIQKALQSEKMAELGTMASQLAHDFQSFITLVKLDVPANSRLRNHANYMEKLVRDLLNYTRPQDLRFAPVNINQLIDMTLDLLNIPPDVVVEKHYADGLPEINVDTEQMRRVFLNLLENSVRAMKKSGGRIKITTRPLRSLSSVRRNPWIYIEILDEGEGIPDEFLERVFDPFFTTHKDEGGNGMGLAIVRQIITRHRGFIDVTSKTGKGTIFNIRLPFLT